MANGRTRCDREAVTTDHRTGVPREGSTGGNNGARRFIGADPDSHTFVSTGPMDGYDEASTRDGDAAESAE